MAEVDHHRTPLGRKRGQHRRIGGDAEGLPRIIVLIGVAGIGKTTLASRLAASCGDRKVFWYRCYECDSIQGVLRSLGGWLKGMGKTALASYMKNTETVEPREAVYSLLSDLDFPHLLVFDDFHRLEHLSPLFSVLLELSQRNPLKILLTSRSVPSFYSRADVGLRKSVSEIELKGLDRQALRNC